MRLIRTIMFHAPGSDPRLTPGETPSTGVPKQRLGIRGRCRCGGEFYRSHRQLWERLFLVQRALTCDACRRRRREWI